MNETNVTGYEQPRQLKAVRSHFDKANGLTTLINGVLWEKGV